MLHERDVLRFHTASNVRRHTAAGCCAPFPSNRLHSVVTPELGVGYTRAGSEQCTAPPPVRADQLTLTGCAAPASLPQQASPAGGAAAQADSLLHLLPGMLGVRRPLAAHAPSTSSRRTHPPTPTCTSALLWCAEKFLSWWDLQGSPYAFLKAKPVMQPWLAC